MPRGRDRGETDPASYAGVYCTASAGLEFTVDAVPGSDRLSIALLPQPAVPVARTDVDTYYGAAFSATFKFVRQDENIVGLWLIQNGQTLPAIRLGARGQAVVARLSPPFPAAIGLDPPVLRQYVGAYSSDVATFTVTLTGDALYVQVTGQPAVPVYASAKDRFFYKIVDAQIRFDRDASGAVTSLTLHQNGADIRATRAKP